MKKLNYLILACLPAVLFQCTKPLQPDTILLENWKFKTGDDLAWAAPETPDTGWADIIPGIPWEQQGYGDYDGYGWYRVNFFLPSWLKNNSFYKDTLQILIGRIDDSEQTFLNGEFLGQNAVLMTDSTVTPGKFEGDPQTYSYFRKYLLPVSDKRIKWDQDNYLAIRVHDHGGLGGLTTPGPSISMHDIKDFLSIDIYSSPFEITKESAYIKKVCLINKSSDDYTGTLTTRVLAQVTGEEIFLSKRQITISAGSVFDYLFSFEAPQTQSYLVTYSFREKQATNTVAVTEAAPYLLTPPPPVEPRINGPKIYGARPESPFLYAIPVSGERPIKYMAENLPAGLMLDNETGIITGSVREHGEYQIMLKAENNHGKDEKIFKIIIGDKLCLTPPMGWNSWNCWGLSVDDSKIRAAVDAFQASGLTSYGWTYINIDDGWEAPERRKDGLLLPNEKFPDMKTLADYVHGHGLKLGIYSSPGPKTCGGFLGSYRHELKDAQTWAEWGIDYLKYDWCSYNEIAPDHSLPELKKPYILMRECLDKINRDIVFSLCQYGMGNVWEWGEEVGGNLWRTTGDITDNWESMSSIGFGQANHYPHAGSGHWNDPDMLVVGWVGWGPRLHYTQLSADEQYTHISLWSLLSAPLLLGCDLNRLDDFTLNLLTNTEVLDIHQDPLDNQAKQVYNKNKIQVWTKDLEDGSKAVGFFNLDSEYAEPEIILIDIGMEGKFNVRDLWRQKDLGEFEANFTPGIPVHGVMLVKFSKVGD